jgi:hypothetical protein
MRAYFEREAHADMAGSHGVPDAQPRYREDFVRQIQNLRDRGGMIANDTDRTAAETRSLSGQNKRLQDEGRINGGVKETFELAIPWTMPTHLPDPLEPVGIAAKHQENRCSTDPRHVGDEIG